MAPSIARVWHRLTREADATGYLRHINNKHLPAYREVRGNCGALVLVHVANGTAEFLVISLWDSLDSVKVFVGSDEVNKTAYCSEDRSYLLVSEPDVNHYQLNGAPPPFLG